MVCEFNGVNISLGKHSTGQAHILAKKTVFVQALFRIRENTYDPDNEPRFSHREVGFSRFDEAPRRLAEGIRGQLFCLFLFEYLVTFQ